MLRNYSTQAHDLVCLRGLLGVPARVLALIRLEIDCLDNPLALPIAGRRQRLLAFILFGAVAPARWQIFVDILNFFRAISQFCQLLFG